jgi:hypothetical protein
LSRLARVAMMCIASVLYSKTNRDNTVNKG